MDEMDALRAERELYRRLCGLAAVDDPQAFVAQTLRLLVDAAQAEQGYLELRVAGEVKVSWAHDMDDVARVREELSSGVLARAINTGEVVESARAMDDPELAAFRSVRARKIQAVLCVPIGEPVFGAIYLQGHRPGGPFDDRVRSLIVDLAKLLAPMARPLVRQQGDDPTAPWRAKLGGAPKLIGRSPALARLLCDLSMMAEVEMSVLITGPAGSGKTQAMRLIHEHGTRSHKKFVERNCSVLSPELAAAELFGTVRGAFTNAHNRRGAVEEADGGTLFLDEVTELDPRVQAMLLRFLESGEYNRVGESVTRHADVRVVAATNADVLERIKDGLFREDLYGRLKGFPIRMPDLSKRTEDILPIAETTLAQFCEKQHWPTTTFTPAATFALELTDWSPGSIRALIHTIQAGAIRAHMDGTPIAVRHLFPDQPDQGETPSWHEATREFQERLLRSTLESCDGNVPEAAKKLDIDRSYIYRMIRSWDPS